LPDLDITQYIGAGFSLPLAAIAVGSYIWLLVQTITKHRAGWVSTVVIPVVLADFTLTYFATTIPDFFYNGILNGILLLIVLGAAFWGGMFFDRNSQISIGDGDMIAQRSTSPLAIWGIGMLLLVIAGMANQNGGIENWGIAFAFAGAAAVLGQSFAWARRLWRERKNVEQIVDATGSDPGKEKSKSRRNRNQGMAATAVAILLALLSLPDRTQFAVSGMKGKTPDSLTAMVEPSRSINQKSARKEEAKSLNEEGVDLFGKNQWAQAEAKFRRAFELDPENADYQKNMGVSLARQNRWAEAEAALETAIQMDPQNARYLADLGVVYREQKRIAEAENAFREAIRCEPSLPVLHNALGALLQNQNRLKEAEDCFREALRLNPKGSLYHGNLAGALYKQGREEEAVREAGKAKRLGLKNHWVFKSLGM
jgi:Flp pilus assembly protein TadD